MLTSLKKIVNDIEAWANGHALIESFHYGPFDRDYQAENNEYPMMRLMETGAGFAGNPSVQMCTIAFRIMFADVVQKNNENELDVLSDELQKSWDFLGKFLESLDDYGWQINEDTFTLEPFRDDFNDVTSGWIVEFTVEVGKPISCEYPD